MIRYLILGVGGSYSIVMLYLLAREHAKKERLHKWWTQ